MAADCRYLEDFDDCSGMGGNMTEHAGEVLRNPLSRFKLIARILHFFQTTESPSMDFLGKMFIVHRPDRSR